MFGFGRQKQEKTTSIPGYVRKAYHAGSWYESSQSELDKKLNRYLKQASSSSLSSSSSSSSSGLLRAIVAPHAGFSYSGPTAAHAYQALCNALKGQQKNDIQHIIVLHPSHHVYLDGCAISGGSKIQTPLGNLTVDDDIRKELLDTGKFTIMEKQTDEEEHSGEMQYPFIAKALGEVYKLDNNNNVNTSIKVLPIMVGAIDTKKEKMFGELLAPILARLNVAVVISSDFCHWGTSFRYQPTFKGKQIFEHIEEMDKTGMSHIEMQNPGAFATYLKQTSNTICGRHPISVWLHAVQTNRDTQRELLDVKFVRYSQSSKATTMEDHSVSYASAVATTKLNKE